MKMLVFSIFPSLLRDDGLRLGYHLVKSSLINIIHSFKFINVNPKININQTNLKTIMKLTASGINLKLQYEFPDCNSLTLIY